MTVISTFSCIFAIYIPITVFGIPLITAMRALITAVRGPANEMIGPVVEELSSVTLANCSIAARRKWLNLNQPQQATTS